MSNDPDHRPAIPAIDRCCHPHRYGERCEPEDVMSREESLRTNRPVVVYVRRCVHCERPTT